MFDIAKYKNLNVLFDRFNEIAKRVPSLRHSKPLQLADCDWEPALIFENRNGVLHAVPVDVVMDADDWGRYNGGSILDYIGEVE